MGVYPTRIRRALPGDLLPLAHILSVAFHHDPVSTWLMPDENDRAERHPQFFRIFLHTAQAYGRVDIASDDDGLCGAALWLDVDPGRPRTDDSLPLQLALGPNFGRLESLLAATGAAHPDGVEYAYLVFVGILPEYQGNGIGTALITERLVALATTGTAAYLEASSPRATGLYRRLGFTPHGEPLRLPGGGPDMHPLIWIPPVTVVAAPGLLPARQSRPQPHPHNGFRQ